MSLLPRLKEIVGEENVTVEKSDLEAYGLDWTRFYKPDPAAIVFARNADQVVKLVTFAKEEGISLVPSGGRTGLSGGACANTFEASAADAAVLCLLIIDPSTTAVGRPVTRSLIIMTADALSMPWATLSGIDAIHFTPASGLSPPRNAGKQMIRSFSLSGKRKKLECGSELSPPE